MINQSRMYLTLASKGMVNLKCEKKNPLDNINEHACNMCHYLIFYWKSYTQHFFFNSKDDEVESQPQLLPSGARPAACHE